MLEPVFGKREAARCGIRTNPSARLKRIAAQIAVLLAGMAYPPGYSEQYRPCVAALTLYVVRSRISSQPYAIHTGRKLFPGTGMS
jgi:hypothetical protein